MQGQEESALFMHTLGCPAQQDGELRGGARLRVQRPTKNYNITRMQADDRGQAASKGKAELLRGACLHAAAKTERMMMAEGWLAPCH